MTRLYEISRTGKSVRTESRLMIAMGWKRAQGFLGDKGRVLKLDFSDGCAIVKKTLNCTL